MQYFLSQSKQQTYMYQTHNTRGGVRGGREGALAPPDLPKFFFFFIMCVVVKGGDLIEIVINSA